jgi:hypothetical protein
MSRIFWLFSFKVELNDMLVVMMLFGCVILSEENKVMVCNCRMSVPRENFIL